MLYILSFLLSWLSGMLVILTTACSLDDQFSLVDIISFAVMTFFGFLIMFLLIYLPVLRMSNKKIITLNEFIYFPLLFALLANLPIYFLICVNTGKYYGTNEATLFIVGFLTSGLVFGLFCAWKNKMLSQKT